MPLFQMCIRDRSSLGFGPLYEENHKEPESMHWVSQYSNANMVKTCLLYTSPLIVSILISRFGPQYKMITYTTMSANLMIREIGISLFLACVGLEMCIRDRESNISTIIWNHLITLTVTALPFIRWQLIYRRNGQPEKIWF